jgi:hypothetical protein
MQGAKQLCVKAGHARFKFLDVRHDLGQTESMCRCNFFGLQGLKDVFPAGAQTIAGQVQHLGHAFSSNEGFDHGTCRLPVQVRHHHAQTDACVGEQFVQPVLFAGEHTAELLPLTGNVAQAAQVRLGNEGGLEQPRACQ